VSPQPTLFWGHPLITEYRWQLEVLELLADPVWRGNDVPRGDGANADVCRHLGPLLAAGSKPGMREAG
jgi:hypothetical protein